MDVNRILNVLSLYKSPKVYLWSLLASIALFFLYWGAKHPYAAGDNTMTALSLAVVFVGGILFVACYTFGNRQLALAFAEKEFQTEPASMMDAVQQGKGYLLSIAALLACFLALTLLAVPALGTIVGGFFIVTVRNFGGYPDAVAFGALIANSINPLLDRLVRPIRFGRLVEAA